MDFGAPVRRSIFRNPVGRNRAVDILQTVLHSVGMICVIVMALTA